LLPPPETIAALALVAAVAYALFAITGFGAALLVVPALTFVLPLPVVLPVAVLLDVAAALMLGARVGRETCWPELKRMVPLSLAGAVCGVTEADCVSCGACVTACTYGAIELVDTPHGKKARVNPILCKGDGVCNAKCPTRAITLKHFTDEAIYHQIDAALSAP